MHFKVTTLYSSDYCQLVPSDTTCHVTHVIEANSKVEAVMELHSYQPNTFGPIRKVTLPEVWSVEVL